MLLWEEGGPASTAGVWAFARENEAMHALRAFHRAAEGGAAAPAEEIRAFGGH